MVWCGGQRALFLCFINFIKLFVNLSIFEKIFGKLIIICRKFILCVTLEILCCLLSHSYGTNNVCDEATETTQYEVSANFERVMPIPGQANWESQFPNDLETYKIGNSIQTSTILPCLYECGNRTTCNSIYVQPKECISEWNGDDFEQFTEQYCDHLDENSNELVQRYECVFYSKTRSVNENQYNHYRDYVLDFWAAYVLTSRTNTSICVKKDIPSSPIVQSVIQTTTSTTRPSTTAPTTQTTRVLTTPDKIEGGSTWWVVLGVVMLSICGCGAQRKFT